MIGQYAKVAGYFHFQCIDACPRGVMTSVRIDLDPGELDVLCKELDADAPTMLFGMRPSCPICKTPMHYSCYEEADENGYIPSPTSETNKT